MMAINQINENDQMYLDEWFRKFQSKDQQNNSQVDDDWMLSLAGALCDDCPLGYEASHRLANWIFNYVNRPRMSKKYLDKINSSIRKQEMTIEELEENFSDYKKATTELIIAIKECE